MDKLLALQHQHCKTLENATTESLREITGRFSRAIEQQRQAALGRERERQRSALPYAQHRSVAAAAPPAPAPPSLQLHRSRRPTTGIPAPSTRLTRPSRASSRRQALESSTTRFNAQRRIEQLIHQMAAWAQQLLQQRLPLYESRIQHLLDQPENEEQVAALFTQIEQANADLPILTSIVERMPNEPLTIASMQCVQRVIQEQYSQLVVENAQEGGGAGAGAGAARRRIQSEEADEEDDDGGPRRMDEGDDDDDDDAASSERAIARLLSITAMLGAIGDVTNGAGRAGGVRPLNPGLQGLFGVAGGATGGAAPGGAGLAMMMNALGMRRGFFDDVPTPMDGVGLQSMPVMTYATYKSNIGAEPNTQCNFCLEEFVDGDEVRCYPCCPRVAQHKTCIDTWLKEHNTCIVCRKNVPDFVRGGAESNHN